MLFVLTAYLSSSCEKEQISPINQEVAFVKYYGHVGAQTATDVVQTADGGYILLGSTNSYSTRQEMDVLVVKTDSLGNELWSSSFGRAAGSLAGDYLRFSEEGVRIIELPNQSAYIVAANRTYFSYNNASSPAGSGIKGQTKIVLYQLDYATGAPRLDEGVELKQNTYERFTEEVSDMKIDTANGVYNYVLTGYTTDIQPNKPNDNDNGALDKTDIFTALLNSQFAIQWTTSSLAYGFPRADYGTSVQILDGGYLICGTSEEKTNLGSVDPILLPRIITVIMEKSGGTPLNVSYFTEESYYFEGGYSVYDSDNGIITIASHVLKKGGSGDDGKVALLQVTENLTPVTPDASGPTHCKYYDLGTRGNKTSGGIHAVASLALVPGNNGFILSSTQGAEGSEFESDLCVTKFDKDLEQEEGWPYFFGYADSDRLVLTKDEAGSIIPVTAGAGNQITVSGYVFTGKFGLGTNEMMGLVRLNLNGELIP
ncbi:MAG: Lipoprotein, putative [uncultured Aureispira sp.]|uniref:Lipoprotein, putative n=1 Tax=uncultured Aureispira sp. TaxID=1331704 RepID=A0A6S6T2A3_9BACT|nr:MAG: Lipoprotein, putative [uncultured Aureispira sp.]